ncbi:MAG: urease accessory protein UreE, partial [Rubricella sp.]
MTNTLPVSHEILRAGSWSGAADSCALTYEDRFLRRKRLRAASGTEFMLDLAHTESLNHGDALRLSDGRLVEIVAAEEPLLEITGESLTRLAWHIGNRHTPAQIEEGRILIQEDHVLADMLAKLGASVTRVT